MTGTIDMRLIPSDLSVFRCNTNVLQVGEFRADVSYVILEFLQTWKPGIRTKCFVYVITKMPRFQGAVSREILIEVVIFEPLHRVLQC